jgi:hypothetical protein
MLNLRWAVPTAFGTIRLNDAGFATWLRGQGQHELADLIEARRTLQLHRDRLPLADMRLGSLISRSKTLIWRIVLDAFCAFDTDWR